MVTILLVPGAWLPVTAYRRLIRALEEEAFQVDFAAYPSFNPRDDPQFASCSADAAHIRDRYILPLIDRGEDVVLVMHSYGGMPGAAAATGLDKKNRQARGQPGGVLGLIMISAHVVTEGRTCVEATGGCLAPWILQDQPRVGLSLIDNPRQVLAADVPEEITSLELQLIEPQATSCFLTPQPRPAFQTSDFKGLLGYVLLRNDRAIPLAVQEAMIAASGADWRTRSIGASHNAPFATRVEETVKVIGDFIEDFRSTDMR